ncbi:MAG TPA: hypothetical protein VI248_02755 [Kineosporiaceae bacterium]
MGRSNGSFALSVVDGCCGEVGSFAGPVSGLLSSLKLRAVGNGQYEIRHPEPAETGWPGARFVASAVLVAEHTFPGYDVRHLSHVAERVPTSGRPTRLVVSWSHVGVTCITGQITFMEDGRRLGEVGVTLQPTPSMRGPSEVRLGRPGPGAGDCLRGGGCGGVALDGPLPWASPISWECRQVSASGGPGVAEDAGDRAGLSWGERAAGGETSVTAWTTVAAPSASPTLQRALLTLVSEPIAALPFDRGPSAGPRATPAVLGRCITFLGAVDLAQGVFATIDCAPAAAGSVLVTVSFRDCAEVLVATVSQTATLGAGGARRPSAGRRPGRTPATARELVLA